MRQRKWMWICLGKLLPNHAVVVVADVASEEAATGVDEESIVDAAMANLEVVAVAVEMESIADVLVEEEEVVVAEAAAIRSLSPLTTSLRSHLWVRNSIIRILQQTPRNLSELALLHHCQQRLDPTATLPTVRSYHHPSAFSIRDNRSSRQAAAT